MSILETRFTSCGFSEALIDDINADIRQAENSLGEDKFKNFTRDAFFTPIQNGSKM